MTTLTCLTRLESKAGQVGSNETIPGLIQIRFVPFRSSLSHFGPKSSIPVTDCLTAHRSLRAEYGDLVSLSVGRQAILLVSGLDTMRKVFVDRGKEFGARPPVFTTLKVGQGKG